MTRAEAGTTPVPGPFATRQTADGRVISLALSGELDLGSAPELDRELREIAQTNPERLILDLSGLSFMDSTGLASIVEAQRVAQADGHELVLRHPTRQVQRLFELTGLTDRFKFDD
jgi:anti-sigma B factor antagonist